MVVREDSTRSQTDEKGSNDNTYRAVILLRSESRESFLPRNIKAQSY